MNRTLKIGVSAALGGFVGALVALQFSPVWAWLGVITGALTGYLSYEYKKIGSGAIKAANIAADRCFSREAVKSFGEGVLALFWGTLFFGSWFIFLALSLGYIRSFWVASFAFTVFIFCGPEFFWPTFMSTLTSGSRLLRLNGFTVWFWVSYRIGLKLRGPVLWLRKNYKLAIEECILWSIALASLMFIGVPCAAIKFSWHFTRNFFLLVHTDERLICAAGAATGAASGYFIGNALVGALIGFTAGIVSYEVFAKRLFKNAIAAYVQQRAATPAKG